MEQKVIKEIVQEYRQKGFGISEQEVEKVLLFSKRKIGMMNLPDPEQYLELLFQDELKNYIYRDVVNTISLQRIAGKGCGKCAARVL